MPGALFTTNSPSSEPPAPETPRAKARLRRWFLIASAILALLLVGLIAYLQSAAFQEKVRARIVSSMEQATGARVELREFTVNWFRLEVTLEGLVLHGTEPKSEAPLFSADSLVARWHLVSFWRLDADLAEVRLATPRINISISQEGSSNLPKPAAASSTPQEATAPWAARLVALQVSRIEVLRGELHWNQRAIPLDFQAQQLRLQLDFDAGHDRYNGQLGFRNAIMTSTAAPQLNAQFQSQFALYSDRAEIESADWQTAKSRLTLQGTVTDWRSPRFTFHYNATADWADLGPLLHSRDWAGSVAWNGNGAIGGAPWALEGDLAVRTERNGIPGWANVPWTARARLRLAEEDGKKSSRSRAWQARLTDLQVSTLGGELRGNGSVQTGASAPVTSLDLQARNLSFPAIAKAAIELPVRLDTLPWASSLSGPLKVRFTGPGRELVLDADLDLAPQPVIPVGYVAASGELSAVYDAARHRLESRDSFVELPHTHLSGNGWFDKQQSQMQLAAQTEDLTEVGPIGEMVWKGFEALPVRLNGQASAQVNWTGGAERADIAGEFQARDFAYRNQPWDRFRGRIEYRSAESMSLSGVGNAPSVSSVELTISSGELTKGSATMNFDVKLGLGKEGFAESSPFSLQARARGFRAEELQQMAGVEYPVTGLVEASADLSGTRRQPAGRGTVSVTRGSLYQEPFDRLTAQLRLDRGVWTADPVRLVKGAGSLAGSVSIDPNGRKFRFDLTAQAVPLGSVKVLPTGEMRLSGTAEGNLSGEGTFEKPQIRGHIDVHQFAYGEIESGLLAVDIRSNEDRAAWSATGDLWGGQVRANGSTLLSASYNGSSDIAFQNVALAPMIRMFREPPENLDGSVSGSLHAEGSFKDMKSMTLRGQLDHLDAGIHSFRFQSAGPAQVQFQNKELRLSALRLQGPRLQFETSGTVRFSQSPELNLDAKGTLNLAALSDADPQFQSSGETQVDAQISGTIANPLWHGRLTISDGSVHYGSFPNGFDRINGTVVFAGNRGNLEKMSAESGGGQVQLAGFVAYGEGSGWQFQLTSDARSVRVRYPEGMSTWVDGQLAWTGSIHSSSLEGRVVMTRQAVSPQFDLVQALFAKKTEQTPAALPEILRNMRLNVELTSLSGLRLDTLSTRSLQADVELRMQGTAAQPVWLGRIGILEGEILFAGKRYAVNHGEISFVNPFRFEPVLNLSVQARVQRYDISMEFNGTPDHLTVTYRSDPPLPTRDILNLLVAGSAQDTSLATTTNQALPQVGADALLSQALRSQIGSRLDRLFGTGRVRVDPQISGLGRSTNASVALEQQVSDNVSLLYVTDVTSTQQQTIQAEWNISPKLSVVGIRDQNGLIGVNFQITLRFP